MKTYYHVIEESNFGEIAARNYYNNEQDAQREVARLQSFFPNLFFYVYPSPSKREPEFVNA